MRFVIVTGMSGAGKSTALKMLEDVGYYCVDNLPHALIPKLAELTSVENAEINKIAVGVDIRSGNNFSEFEQILDQSAGYGLYIMAITQSISKMPSSIIANAGLKFIGKISRAEDVNVAIRNIGREENYTPEHNRRNCRGEAYTETRRDCRSTQGCTPGLH